MLRCLIIFVLGLTLVACHPEIEEPYIDQSDIQLFWTVFDELQTIEGTPERQAFFEDAYMAKGSIGLQKMIRARGYTSDEFVAAIENYPEFWASIRAGSLAVDDVTDELRIGLSELRAVYPNLKPSRIYFTIGALRSNGTILEGDVLIGSELAFADTETRSDELAEDLPHLLAYFRTNPKQDIVALLLHEYVHTQQTEGGGHNLLSWTLYEGVAEYVSTAAIDRESKQPSIKFGRQNNDALRDHFESEIFSPWTTNWLWNSTDNAYGERDLGYYIGYAIAEKYVSRADDASVAIAELIELDYKNSQTVEAVVEASGYFSVSLEELRTEFENARPFVVDHAFKRIEDEPAYSTLTITFSSPMDTCCASSDAVAGGGARFPNLKSVEFSDDGMSVIYKLAVEEAGSYRMLLTESFRSQDALPLKPYLVEFEAQ